MTAITRPNDFAFPGGDTQHGATVREWLAAQAMQGFLAAGINTANPDTLARNSVRYADALILALNQASVTTPALAPAPVG